MGCVVILYLFLGCIMDQVAIQLITLPLTFPLVTGLGYDPIWFGVIVTKLAEIGMVTPPVGMNAYVVSATTKTPLDVVFRGTSVLLTWLHYPGPVIGVSFPFHLPAVQMMGRRKEGPASPGSPESLAGGETEEKEE